MPSLANSSRTDNERRGERLSTSAMVPLRTKPGRIGACPGIDFCRSKTRRSKRVRRQPEERFPRTHRTYSSRLAVCRPCSGDVSALPSAVQFSHNYRSNRHQGLHFPRRRRRILEPAGRYVLARIGSGHDLPPWCTAAEELGVFSHHGIVPHSSSALRIRRKEKASIENKLKVAPKTKPSRRCCIPAWD